MKKYLKPAGLLALLSACTHDSITRNDCPLSSAVLYGSSSTVNKTADFHYGADGVNEVVFSSGERFTLSYVNGLPYRRDFYQSGSSTPFQYDSLVYNGGRTPAALLRYERSGPSVFAADSTVPELTNGLLTGLRIYERSTPGSSMQPLRLYRFTHNGSNIAGYILDRYSNGVLSTSDTVTVQTDNVPNYFNRIHPEFYLYHPEWAYGLGDEIYFQMNANNITGVGPAAATTLLPITYSSDDRGRLTQYSTGGSAVAGFGYDCP